jgi:hypothetical protein
MNALIEDLALQMFVAMPCMLVMSQTCAQHATDIDMSGICFQRLPRISSQALLTCRFFSWPPLPLVFGLLCLLLCPVCRSNRRGRLDRARALKM